MAAPTLHLDSWHTTAVAWVELQRAEWLPLQQAHAAATQARVEPHLTRRASGQRHPIDDFLWDYYPFSTGKFRVWNPGVTTVLLNYTAADGALPRGFTIDHVGARFDVNSIPEHTATALHHEIEWVHRLLSGTRNRPSGFGCFGLHEWAMLLGQADSERRHPDWPLRVSHGVIRDTIDTIGLRCTHFDAWRFFTPESLLRNPWSHSRATQPDSDQGGCLHANMDIYKWSMRLQPLVPSSLVIRAFDLALCIRQLDMASSPYDFSHLGLEPVPVETAPGRATFARQQREYASQAHKLRVELLDLIEQLAPQIVLGDATIML